MHLLTNINKDGEQQMHVFREFPNEFLEGLIRLILEYDGVHDQSTFWHHAHIQGSVPYGTHRIVETTTRLNE